ncbi:hypothetical protein VWY73_12480 [Phaeobacter sp. JH20_12]|uniref:hypothetical protein n=1 Tax=unclassified Phaeobacter TaxID=2621772 RepID=UPI003A88043A
MENKSPSILTVLIATCLPIGQHFLLLGGVLFGPKSFQTFWYDWVLALFVPFYGWYKILFG